MTVKLYKLDASPPARTAMMACDIFNVPVELIDVQLMQGEHKKPEYLKKNPTHTVPVLEDGNLVINDSHAIIQYLAEAYGKDDSWYPKDVKKRALVNQKLFFDTGILFPRMRNITDAECNRSLLGHHGVEWPERGQNGKGWRRLTSGLGDDADIERERRALSYSALFEGERKTPQKKLDDVKEAYGFLEEFLKSSKFLAGDHLTIADVSAFATVSSLAYILPIPPQTYPKINAWLEEIKKQPFAQKYNEPGLKVLGEYIKASIDF